MMRSLLAALMLVLFAAPLAAQQNVYEVGQVWEFETAPSDEGALIKIQEIETGGTDAAPKEVFHISMIGVNYSPTGADDTVQHLPVSRKTLDSSVTQLTTTTRKFPDHRQGLKIWREAVGGVFDISLAEITNALRARYAELMKASGQPRK